MIKNSATLGFHIIGSDTQVGRALTALLADKDIPYRETSVRDSVEKKLLTSQLIDTPHPFILNALFEGDIDGKLEASRTKQKQWLSIADTLTDVAFQKNSTIIHLSNALVFSGDQTRGYSETDEPNSPYSLGQLFLKVEEKIQQKCPGHIIVRTSWVFSEYGDNFMIRLVNAVINQPSLQISGKLIGCPTDAHVLAKVIVAIAEQIDCAAEEPELWGVYHYVDSDACSLHTFAKAVANSVKSMVTVQVDTIEEGDTDDLPGAVELVENFELTCKKILSTFGIKQRPWRRGIKNVLKDFLSSDSNI